MQRAQLPRRKPGLLNLGFGRGARYKTIAKYNSSAFKPRGRGRGKYRFANRIKVGR
jgi:hypothetical protein